MIVPNTGISDYPVRSRNPEYQKGSEGKLMISNYGAGGNCSE